jgi:hypothetical protein
MLIIDLCRLLDIKKKHVGTWRIFSLRELHAATNNFNYDNKLGEGSFGSVYWGQLASGDQVWKKEPLSLKFSSFHQLFIVTIYILEKRPHMSLILQALHLQQ